MTSSERDAFFANWTELLWSISSKEGGAMLDEEAFRKAILEQLKSGPGYLK